VIKNIIILLFCALLGLLGGLYYGYLWGRDDINHRLVVTSYNSGWETGNVAGSRETMYMLFQDYIESNPYNINYEE